MLNAQRRIRRVVITIMLALAIWSVGFCFSVLQQGVSYDFSITFGSTTVNAYHYQPNARYQWGTQDWGYAP